MIQVITVENASYYVNHGAYHTLMANCFNGTMMLALNPEETNWQVNESGQVDVRFSIDGGERHAEAWRATSNGSKAVLENAEADELMTRFEDADQVHFALSNAEGKNLEITFDMAGAAKAFAYVRENCTSDSSQ
ncbi:hypothetical protein CKO21_17965 [Rhodovibrio salinarum]|uniref:Uncharacterized protein n=1 Tax=Rhodovibrio salinarum TaxID=1087 RepID=A0A934V364_9PROT|nr:hypothetical protein [Rhodovibrio salinarum]